MDTRRRRNITGRRTMQNAVMKVRRDDDQLVDAEASLEAGIEKGGTSDGFAPVRVSPEASPRARISAANSPASYPASSKPNKGGAPDAAPSPP